MSELVEIMIRPFVACLVLTGMHVYLGLHVVTRGVIFVDLALAQLAALGATTGLLCGWGLHTSGSYLSSLAFTVAGALIFSFIRARPRAIPQEALIGIVYAIASAASILVLSRSADGGEELKSLLVGHLLFVKWEEILEIAVVYAVFGAFFWICHRPLYTISSNPELAQAQGRKLYLWDFAFYASFGCIVTSSTGIAGVLLVFSFLVVPAVCALILAPTFRAQLCAGWLCGSFSSALGIAASYYFDLPTGAAIVCTFGLSVLSAYAVRCSARRLMLVNAEN